MAGYTPLFDSLLTGTLYGKWPHNGIWALLLSRASREGVIDETPECIAGHIGIPVPQLMESIAYFMCADPASRSKDDDGRRLTLIDADRAWGWKIVNHRKYREKARKKTFDETRTDSGADAERKRRERAAYKGVPTRPDASSGVPPSESESESDKAEEAAAFDISECPKDMDAVAEQKTFCEWCGEKGKAPTIVRWRRWVNGAKQSGRYARCKPRPPTDEECRAERNRIARAQDAA